MPEPCLSKGGVGYRFMSISVEYNKFKIKFTSSFVAHCVRYMLASQPLIT
jgi:hypothetical protein